MEIKDMIRRYKIRLHPSKQDTIAVYGIDNAKRDNALPEIKAHKPEILAELIRERDDKQAEQEAAKEAARRKESLRKGIEGLSEIIAAREAWAKYKADFNAAMDDEFNDGAFMPSRPTVDPKELAEKYPRAAAYLAAESYELAANDVKAAAGKKATARILNGEDYNLVLADMEKEWKAHCTAHMWD